MSKSGLKISEIRSFQPHSTTDEVKIRITRICECRIMNYANALSTKIVHDFFLFWRLCLQHTINN